LPNFFILFRAAYGAAVDDMPWRELRAETLLADRSKYVQEFYGKMCSRRPDVEELFHYDLGDRELLFTKVIKESPLVFWWEAVSTALTFAVILSGGEVDLAQIQVGVPGERNKGVKGGVELVAGQVNRIFIGVRAQTKENRRTGSRLT